MANKVQLADEYDNIIGTATKPVVTSAAASAYANLTSGTTTVKTGAGTFEGLVVNSPGTTVTATIYDNTAGSGTKIATVALTAGMSLRYAAAFATGLTVVLSGAADITVIYR